MDINVTMTPEELSACRTALTLRRNTLTSRVEYLRGMKTKGATKAMQGQVDNLYWVEKLLKKLPEKSGR